MSAPIIHGGGITAAAKAYGGKPEDWLDLSTGINPNPVAIPPIPVRAWHRLPDEHLVAFARKAAAGYYGCGEALPLAVPGTQSVIQLLPRLADRSRRVAILSPTYGEYARAFELAGMAVDKVAGLEDIVADHGLAVVVNPNNPDGRAFASETLERLWKRLRQQDTVLVVDEAFGDTDPSMSLAPRIFEMPGLVIFRSFGKFFGLAGMRLGFAIAEEAILRRFEEWLGPWAVSGPALSVAEQLMRSDAAPIALAIAERRRGLAVVLEEAGLMVSGGTSLFALVTHPQASALHAHLCGDHILVRKFDYAPHWLRIGLAPDEAGDRRLAMSLRTWNAAQ
ncbi:threonine-phosphate decarboxylase CobD [Rhizobiaceae bacterium n13]|uniref:threonine-phosphate decarboxylase n=1 Tax=Ferirhizobium litorale TaxID=2927786 RepID=A0AAE3QI51_9HYPH|nr:threonine-phosphate decarboxylase CobD [Fererhizobium litorale]MDI7863571.1 threonine-phosphate decarboxylase CobD [Fererhizobium litorale]MDI7923508.1 threonine-phosphate decarboxylase CobD [Fererhizobium litorale]